MARKSRKETAAVAVQETDAACRAAIYVRLSVEDTHTHSVSIETQQMIIARYLEQYPEISVYDTYIDNGATGTNFHRPGFQQMLSDIEAGHVNCVIVKDLSRLGRNTIDTGYYIEQYFRIRNIRFIAVNENFDTVAPEDAHSGIIIPLRNMINEAYALDIGRKIRAQQRQAMKDGKFIGARTPYGYLKAEDDCHQLIIDPVAAVVVQRMFRWASEGAGLNTIAVRLNEAGVLTPSHYKKMQGKITHENLLGSGKWQTRTVGVILRSEVYTGDLVQGQTKTVDHRQVKADAEEWTVVRNTHEAIISREQFAAVQEILNQTASRAKAREVKAYTPNLLKGKVFCAHCGGSLHRQRNIRKKFDDVYFYHCLSQSRISKDTCPGVTIREDALLDMLADMLQDALDTALGEYTLSLAELPRQAADRAELREKITSRKQEIQRLRGIVRSLYENLVHYHASDKYQELCDWYDGYLFGNTEIFNPWSVIGYFNNNCRPKAFWQSTGSNDIIREVLASATPDIMERLELLMKGESFVTHIDTGVIYPQIQNDPSSVYSFLLVAGYLKAVSCDQSYGEDYMCEVALPNKEISFVYSKEILSQLENIIPRSVAIAIQEAIYKVDSDSLQKTLEKFLLQTISFHDAANETFYHGLILGMCAVMDNSYRITSNREAGDGRFDIQMLPLNKRLPGILIELKAGKDRSETHLEDLANVALQQINDRAYSVDLQAMNVTSIIKIGIAFSGKRTHIAAEKQNIE